MSKVSVVIPVYNVEKYLRKCVESVIAQTYKDFNVILVDDGSTDNSGKICDELAYTDNRIRVIHQENKGLGGARNTGIMECNTEYIFFLDSDDYINPKLIEKCVNAAEKNDCDMVLFDGISVYPDGKPGVIYGSPVITNKVLTKKETSIISKYPCAWDKFYRTSLFKKNDIYFPDRVWYEDLRTTPKLFLFAEKVMKIESEPLYYYLQRSDSIMHTINYARVVRDRTEAVDDLISYYKKHGKDKEYYDMLSFIAVYHAFLLPCLEFYRTPGNHSEYMLILLKNLNNLVSKPLENPYLYLLNRNEKIILSLALKKQFLIIKIVTAFNRTLKKLKYN